MNVEIGTEAPQFLSWEYINRIFFAVHSTVDVVLVYILPTYVKG
jgi:hypothetical protein